MEWVDQELPQSLKMCLTKLWSMYEEENTCRLRERLVNAEAYFKMRDKKLKVENELRLKKRLCSDGVGEGGGTFPVGPCKTGSY